MYGDGNSNCGVVESGDRSRVDGNDVGCVANTKPVGNLSGVCASELEVAAGIEGVWILPFDGICSFVVGGLLDVHSCTFAPAFFGSSAPLWGTSPLR